MYERKEHIYTFRRKRKRGERRKEGRRREKNRIGGKEGGKDMVRGR